MIQSVMVYFLSLGILSFLLALFTTAIRRYW